MLHRAVSIAVGITAIHIIFGATFGGRPGHPYHCRRVRLRPLLDCALDSAANAAPPARPRVAVSKSVVSFVIFIRCLCYGGGYVDNLFQQCTCQSNPSNMIKRSPPRVNAAENLAQFINRVVKVLKV